MYIRALQEKKIRVKQVVRRNLQQYPCSSRWSILVSALAIFT